MTDDRSAQLTQLVDAHRSVYDGLLAATAELEPDDWDAPTGCPGWNVHDQLAHCVGFERRLLGDPDRDPDVVVGDLDHLTGDAGRFIERDVEARRAMPHDDLREEAREAFARRVEALEQLSPDDLGVEVDWLLGRQRRSVMLRMRLFDLACHERDVRAAVGRLEGFTGPHVEIATEHTLRLFARHLPTRVEGAGSLHLDVGGADLAAIDLGTGTLTRGDDVVDPPVARLQMSPAELLALAGGRADAPDVDDLSPEGDRALLTHVLAVAGMTL